MDTFVVDPAEFYTRNDPHRWPDLGKATQEIVDRYDVRNNAVLSLGSGSAPEEFWFWQAGCKLTLVDSDAAATNFRQLIKMVAQPDGLTFCIADGAEYVDKARGPFDVVFMSGYTPDEIRRYDMLHSKDPTLIEAKEKAGLPQEQWAPWQEPFHDTTIRAVRLLAPGGLLIIQSFGYGIDAVYHQHFLPAAERQLRAAGASLIDVHRNAYWKGVNLFVAQREGGELPPMTAPITRLQGRAVVDTVERIWPRDSV